LLSKLIAQLNSGGVGTVQVRIKFSKMDKEKIKSGVKNLTRLLQNNNKISLELERQKMCIRDNSERINEAISFIQSECKHEFPLDKPNLVGTRGECLICGYSDY